MKVKVINKNTNEQFDCKEVEIDGYKYYFHYNTESKKIGQYYITKENQIDIVKTGKELGKPILCTNNPNIDLPKVVDEAKMLADLKEAKEYSEVDPFDPCGYSGGDFNMGYQKGYNKAKEQFGNSDKDMIDFAEWCSKKSYKLCANKEWILLGTGEYKIIASSTEELLQLWKEQQPKIVYYE